MCDFATGKNIRQFLNYLGKATRFLLTSLPSPPHTHQNLTAPQTLRTTTYDFLKRGICFDYETGLLYDTVALIAVK